MSASKLLLDKIAADKVLLIFIYVGVSQWTYAEIAKEIKQGCWLVAPVTTTLLFDTPIKEKWRSAAKTLGVHSIVNIPRFVGHC